MDLQLLEKYLKKRWSYEYKWGRKQNNEWDNETNFIYKIRTFSELLKRIEPFDADLRNYALNRWYNFWSAMGVEYIFSTHKIVIPNKNHYDKLVDFKIGNISFDHKTSILPQGWGKSLEYAKQNEKELIEWLYINQSQQGRMHLKNRLFIVLYDSIGQEHWKLKAEILFLKYYIDNYITNFNVNNLCKCDFGEGVVLSDVIWVVK
jgi:hypothetical protein